MLKTGTNEIYGNAESRIPIVPSPFDSDESLTALSSLLLSPIPQQNADLEVSPQEFEGVVALAGSHHVIMRAMEVYARTMSKAGDLTRSKWAVSVIATENARIENALSFLARITAAFEAEGCDVTVIKSLDHWPDLGSDLDLYTNAEPAKVIQLMGRHFGATPDARSWGDRLANKWNFVVPGLPELVEVHVRRLGQTGEQVGIAHSVAEHSTSAEIGGHLFRVPAAEDRLMISTMQRMYRHFYVRLCDIIDMAKLVESRALDYGALRSSASAAGIWEGVATYLVVVSDFVKYYRGWGLDLPTSVRMSASFGGHLVRFRRGFLRLPIMPHSARLYASQFTQFLRNGQLRNTARLSLLPCLATAAVVGQKITGSDKGIW